MKAEIRVMNALVGIISVDRVIAGTLSFLQNTEIYLVLIIFIFYPFWPPCSADFKMIWTLDLRNGFDVALLWLWQLGTHSGKQIMCSATLSWLQPYAYPGMLFLR